MAKKKNNSIALEAKQKAVDVLFNDLLTAVDSAAATGKFVTAKSIPANIPDSVHNLMLNQLRSFGFKVEVTDSNDFNDEITISWE